MNDSRINGTEKISKKEARKVVYEKLASALAEYKGGLSEKKFRNKLKKATRLFAEDIAKASKQQSKNGNFKQSESLNGEPRMENSTPRSA